jgi:hypothetical protein
MMFKIVRITKKHEAESSKKWLTASDFTGGERYS